METVYVLIKTDPGSLENIITTVMKINGVVDLSPVTGAYDIIVKVEGKYITDALSTVVKDIRKIEGVQSTETLIAVKL
jgi:DNA-binding Lrp family transcriptional regulator